jgi:protein-S-isoprenylcysteine O-methyltransferase Ste14
MTPLSFVGYAWLGWFVSWILAAWWQDRAVKRPTTSSEIAYRVLTMVGAVLLFGFGSRYLGGDAVLWRPARLGQWTLVAAVLAGFAVAWWARLHIGRMWSSGVTRKADHHVVDTGPYGLVRHPIYSGVILSVVATAAMRGTAHSWIGTAVLVVGFYVKARLEERFLREQLGPAYDDYAKRVHMLVPFIF